ncbi:trypsin 3A1-like [Drosophila tropicalis]|uniref:trypsin 3A1-like n=1 Tax=Drosophila tropicalis TaxID=46794 RepID=UPI0035AC22F3
MWSTKSVFLSLRLLLILCSAAEVIGISGGTFAGLGRLPHHVSLSVENNYIAGGSLVSELFVLTCAHCLSYEINKYTVHIGIIDLEDTSGQTIRPKQFILHPKYNQRTFDYDIGLIHLSSPAVINRRVQIITLPAGNTSYPEYVVALVAGYGDTDPYKTRDDCLKYVNVSIWDREDCNPNNYNHLTNHGMICGGDDNGKNSPCDGDAGGGLILSNILLGVYFTGSLTCGSPDYPDVYQFVPYHRQWIDEVMQPQYIRKKEKLLE